MGIFFKPDHWDTEHVNLALARRIKVDDDDNGYVVMAYLPVSISADGDTSAFEWVNLSGYYPEEKEALAKLMRIVASI